MSTKEPDKKKREEDRTDPKGGRTDDAANADTPEPTQPTPPGREGVQPHPKDTGG